MVGFGTRTLATRFVKIVTGDYQLTTVQNGETVVLGAVLKTDGNWRAHYPDGRSPTSHLTRRGAARALVDHHLQNQR